MNKETLQRTQGTNRLAYIDMAKAAALLVVVLFHKQGMQQTMLQRFGTAFHMPVFFFLFGMTTSGGKNLDSLWQGVRRRFRSLMVPYYLWVVICTSTWDFSLRSILMIIYGSHPGITAAGTNATLWFLPTMFVSACLFDVVTFYEKAVTSEKKCLMLNVVAIVAAAALSFVLNEVVPYLPIVSIGRYPLNMDIALSGFCFLMTGHLLRSWIDKIRCKSNSLLLLLSVVLFLATLLLAEANQVRIVMARGIYGNYILFLAAGLTGSIGVVLLMAFCERFMGVACRPMIWLGQHSLFVFASHHIVFKVLNRCYQLFGIQKLASMPGIFMYSMLAITICCLCCAVIGRLVPALEGK